MFELYFTGLKYADQAKKFRKTGHYQMSKTRMTPGTSSMLRARRRDVNAKPNRVLDKSSSRGMIYENEELRLRTININAEVEKGQHDIKKLRRENEQLRREIWTLREEYDRLESLLRKRQLSEEEGENSEGEEEEDEENGEGGEDDGGGEEVERDIDKSKLQPKLEFDELSVVEEEPEDCGTEDERRNRSEDRTGEESAAQESAAVPEIRISEADGSVGSERRRLNSGDVIRGMPKPCQVEECRGSVGKPMSCDPNSHYDVPKSKPFPIHPPPLHNRPRSDSLQKQNSIHPAENEPTSANFSNVCHQGDQTKQGVGYPSNGRIGGLGQQVIRQPVLISASAQPMVSDVLVDNAKVFQNLFERRAVLRRPQQLSKSDNEDKGSGVAYNLSDSHSSHASSNSAAAPSTSSGDSQECQLYVPPPQTLRLHCVQPFTLVFSVQDFEQLTVIDVIDILDEQLPPEVRGGLKGARIIEEQCYVSFSTQDQVNAVLRQGIQIGNSHIQLQDASIGTAVIALTGVPHDVDDTLVANILSSFGTILGSIERRMYKGVDTGERIVRLRPDAPLPSFLFIMGQRVTLRVLRPEEISCLRLKRRKSFRSQINLNIKLLENDDIIIEPVVQPSASHTEYHTMPSLYKRQQRVPNPLYHSMPRISRQAPTPTASTSYIPDNATYSLPRCRHTRTDDEPEYANIPSDGDVAMDRLLSPHACKKVEINPQKGTVGSHEHFDITEGKANKQGSSHQETCRAASEVPTTECLSPTEVKNKLPSLRIQTMKNSAVTADTGSGNETAATSQVDDRASVFDFTRKSSIKFERGGESGSSRSSKNVHSPKISRKLSIYNPPETPNGKSNPVPSTPQTSGNETSSPKNSKKSPKRITKKSIKNIDGKTPAECSQSSSEGQESPTKHRKLLSMKGKKGLPRQASGEQTDVPTSPAEGTTCSERERSYSDSSSIVTRRKMSSTGREGTGKVPWCGCWGNGCL